MKRPEEFILLVTGIRKDPNGIEIDVTGTGLKEFSIPLSGDVIKSLNQLLITELSDG